MTDQNRSPCRQPKLFLAGLPGVVVACLIAMISFGQQAAKTLEVGDAADQLSFEVFNTKTVAKQIALQQLKGKVVILEFWATWCAPCLPPLYRLSDLQKEFPDSLLVVAVSIEPKDKITKTIRKMGIDNMLFSSDTAHTRYLSYSVVPTSVIIDPAGIIRGIASPREITEEKIRKLLRKDSVSFAVDKDNATYQDLRLPDVQNKGDGSVARYDSTETTGITIDTSSSFKQLSFTNFTLLSLFREVFRMPSPAWVIDSSGSSALSDYVPANMYNLRVKAHGVATESLFLQAEKLMNSSFQYVGSKTVKEIEVYELLYNGLKKLSASGQHKTSFSYYGPNFKGVAVTTSALTDYLSNELGYLEDKIVLDKTGLTSQYDINLTWEYTDRGSLNRELARYGFYLKKVTRPVGVLIVSVRN
jgi:uncharacterized protein (TIGR03435 family)